MYIVLDTNYDKQNNGSTYMVVTTEEDVVEPVSTEMLGKIGKSLCIRGAEEGIKPNSIAEAIMLQLSGLHVLGLDVQVYGTILGSDTAIFKHNPTGLLDSSCNEVKDAIAYLSRRYGFEWQSTDLYRAVFGRLMSDFKLPWGISFIQTMEAPVERSNSRVLLSDTVLTFFDFNRRAGLRDLYAVDYSSGVLPYKKVPETDDWLMVKFPLAQADVFGLENLRDKIVLTGGCEYTANNGSMPVISSYCYSSLSMTRYEGTADLEKIESRGIFGCPMLTTIDLSKSTKLGNLPEEAFYGCCDLQYILLNNNEAMTELDYTENGFNSVFQRAGAVMRDYQFVALRLDHSTKLERVNLKASTMLLSLCGCPSLTTIECGLNWSPKIDMLDCTDCHKLSNLVMGGINVRVNAANFTRCYALVDLFGFMRKCGSHLEQLDVSHCTQFKQFGSKHYFSGAIKLKTFVGYDTAVEELQDYCFYSAHSLTAVDLHGCKHLKRIGAYVFDRCSELRIIDLTDCTSLESVDIHAFPCAMWRLLSIKVGGCSSKVIEQIDNALQEYETKDYHWVYDEKECMFRRERGERAGLLKDLARLLNDDFEI